MAMRVAAAGFSVVNLDVRYPDGTAWICSDNDAEHCGVAFLAGRPVEPGIRLEASKDGAYDGWFAVGSVTASPPAAFPELGANLDAKIAAAVTSPQTLINKARRAYQQRRFAECADLLAKVATPDAGTTYDHACCLARAGRKDEALAKLRAALEAGFEDLAHVAADEDLVSLHADPRWPIGK